MQAILIRRKKKWNIFMKKNSKVLSFAHWSDGVNTMKRVRNIFSIWRKGPTSKKHVRKFKINGTITTDPFKILSEEKRFYQELYTSKNLGNKQATEIFLNSLNIPRLTDEQKLSCEGSITEEECVKALHSFQGNKAPGNDGFPIEFYSKCWEIISEPSSTVSTRFSLVVKCPYNPCARY